ncbi:hypothetical protein [Chryseobacterium mucoviscidosis]|uniref:hypothetical protein n=1 Tax=Chryseobacterium mucoviscidosis TaxID=1945581 RepID=UPI0030187639
MKEYEFELNESMVQIFFPHERIKNKIQVLKILIEATRLIMYNDISDKNYNQKLVLKIKKMSRLFFITKNKYYSINFPFTFYKSDKSIEITYKNQIVIDSKILSDILSIINDNRFNSLDCFDFIEPFIDFDSKYSEQIWFLLKELLTLEDGYVRFDNDKESFEKAKANETPHRHPENHFDIFYTSSNNIKIGLLDLINDKEFIDYFDLQTDCKYLKKFNQ